MTQPTGKIIDRKLIINLVICQIFLTLMSSCVSLKSVTYFQGKDGRDSARYSTIPLATPSVPRIEEGDILAIIVASLSEESNKLFNFPNITPVYTTIFPGATSQGQQPLGYMVDESGNVNLPLAGKVKVAGLSIKDANTLVTERLNRYLKDPSVNIRQLNQKVTVIGEVNRPGVLNLLNAQTSLPELLGMAGDLTIFGRRDNVMLIRTKNDKREVVRLDLTSRNVLNSPYFFVQNNDVIYIEPRSARVTAADRTVQLLPIFLGLTSSILVLVSIFLK
jgi:polysaccharide export outer membrane protein